MNDEDIPTIARNFPELITSTRELRATVDKAVEERRKEARQVRVAILVLLFLGAVLVIIAVSNRQIATTNHRVLSRVEDCATEGGRCLEESEARRGKAVDRIVAELTAEQRRIAVCERATSDPAALDVCLRGLSG